MKKRLDQLLTEQGYFPSRAQAQAAILAGLVFINGRRVDKAGTLLKPDVSIEVKGKAHPYVGRGGVKLAKALEEFDLELKGKIALDVGASTGGFTDCLLQRGVTQVYAVDVGYGQMDWKLRNDPRVKVIERTNARYLTLEILRGKIPKTDFHLPGLAVIDVSFISLAKILPAVYNLLSNQAEVIALIKPQFEARRDQVGRGGIVKEEKVHREVIEKVKRTAAGLGFKVKGLIQSPISGADGNIEFFIYLIKES